MAEIRSFYYTEGNTVRQVAEPLPNRREIEEQERIRRERNRRRQQRKHAAMMRQKRLYAMYFAFLIGAFGAFFVGYVTLTNNITTHMDQVSALETEISDLKAENNAVQSRIDTASNLSEVKTRAMNDLGMVYAGSDQIVYYNMDDSDYMSQYHEIP